MRRKYIRLKGNLLKNAVCVHDLTRLVSLHVTFGYRLSGILVGSTICNILLLKNGVPKKLAFWITLYGFGFVSFILLKFVSATQPKDVVKKNDNVVKKTQAKPKTKTKTNVGKSQKAIARGGAAFMNIVSLNDVRGGDIISTVVDRRNWGKLLEDDNFCPPDGVSRRRDKYSAMVRSVGVSTLSTTLI